MLSNTFFKEESWPCVNVGTGVGVLRAWLCRGGRSAAAMVSALGGGGVSLRRYFIIILFRFIIL